MKGLQQRQAAHVPHEQHAVVRERVGHALQHMSQIVQTREILGDRVEHHQVELVGSDPRKIVGGASFQADLAVTA